MTAGEADAGEALWRRLTVPEKDRRKLLDNYRDAILHAAAERIRRAPHDGTGDTWGWWDAAEIPDHCADLIDPDKQETP